MRGAGRERGCGTGRCALRGPGAPAGDVGARRRPQQNSQRVFLAKPRTAVVSHCGRCGEPPRAVWLGGASREGGEPPRAVAVKRRALA